MPSDSHLSRLFWRRSILTLTVVALCVAGVSSAVIAVHLAVSRSQDFQWSGERLLLRHIDPWQTFLDGDREHALVGTQIPNYLPILYVLLVPIGLLSQKIAYVLWACLNVYFAVISCVISARFYGLRGWLWIVAISGAMLIAAPTRTTISNGQQGLLVLVLWTLAWLLPSLTKRSYIL